MMNPVRVATGWLAGRLLVFLAILAALVAMDAYREESTLLGVMLKGLVPDRELVQRLEDGRTQIEDSHGMRSYRSINACETRSPRDPQGLMP